MFYFILLSFFNFITILIPNFKFNILKEAFCILEKIIKCVAEVRDQIEKCEKELKELPSGNFVCCSSGGKSKWYVSDGHTRSYIPKKDRALAAQLAYKKYVEASLSELIEKKDAMEKYIASCSVIKPASAILEKSEEMRKLITPILNSLSEDSCQWMNSPYTKNPKKPENLIHKSVSENFLRSKSESIIDMCLFNSNIPYRYECQLMLGGYVIYPDFTILNVRTGKMIYWEHFGCMDNAEYAMHACEKIKLYVSNGIIPSIDLIITFETKDKPLTADQVMNIINEYLL